MKGVKIALGLLVFCAMTFCLADAAFCRSTSLTTTLIITVKKPPMVSVVPGDRNIDSLKELAKSQPMGSPHVKETAPDVKFSGDSGGKIYTITDRL